MRILHKKHKNTRIISSEKYDPTVLRQCIYVMLVALEISLKDKTDKDR